MPARLDRVGAELLLRAALTATVAVLWLGFLGCVCTAVRARTVQQLWPRLAFLQVFPLRYDWPQHRF